MAEKHTVEVDKNLQNLLCKNLGFGSVRFLVKTSVFGSVRLTVTALEIKCYAKIANINVHKFTSLNLVLRQLGSGGFLNES